MIIRDELREDFLTAIRDRIDAGEDRARLVIISGKREGGHVISEHQLSKPCGSVKDCCLYFAPIAEDMSARRRGVPTWGKIYDGNRRPVLDLKVGTDILLNTKMVDEGQNVCVDALKISMA